MLILEGYIAKWNDYPDDEIKVRVARPGVLAPSKTLLEDYKSGKISWPTFERKFLLELHRNPEAIEKLKQLAELSKNQNVRLICYEKTFPCHRFILVDIIKAINGVDPTNPNYHRYRRLFGRKIPLQQVQEELPVISERDYEILKWHCAGKKHTWIAKKFKVSLSYIRELLMKTGKGYIVKRRRRRSKHGMY